MSTRRDYPELLASLQPAQAVTVLNERVKRIGRVNSEIADWIQERRRIEGVYAQGLRKLARRQPPDDASELGTFQAPWQKIISATESMASSHQVLAQRIEVDVERPLKEFVIKNRDVQSLSTVQGNLAAMARDVQSATDKVESLRKKGTKAGASKVVNAASELESATSQWNSQAPFVFENLQVVDEARLNHLREVLTRFQTHEVDQVERNRVTAEDCLNALLNVETADEISAFVSRTRPGKVPVERPSSRTMNSSTGSPPVSSTVPEDATSLRSGISAAHGRTDAVGQETRTDRLGGLRRLGTLMTRRKSMAASVRGISPEKGSVDKQMGLQPGLREIPPLPPTSGLGSAIMSSLSDQDRPELPQTGSSLTSQHTGSHRAANATNGVLNDASHPTKNELEKTVNGSDVTENQPPQFSYARSSAPIRTTQDEEREQETTTGPPSALDPISQAEHEASIENVQSPLKLDIRNVPIQEEDGEAQTAMANVANTLRVQAAQSRKPGTPRGRRDVRNTIFVPSPQPSEIGSSDSPALHPLSKPGRAATFPSEDHTSSDAHSVRSARSATNPSTMISVRHPDMHGKGLNSSIVEIISAWFDNSRVTKAAVIGEIALTYNSSDPPATMSSEIVRLENFAGLEKVAPNPTFVTSIPEKSGEYSLKVGNITRTAVAFKYQVHLEESNLAAYAPIVACPSWKMEPTQASIILTYSLSPDFSSLNKKSITFRNLTFVIHLEGAKPSACQSKPVGTFSKERGLIFWQLGDMTLEAGAPPSKLLARFATDVEAKPGNIEAKWEISSEDAAGLGSQLSLSQIRSQAVPAASESQDDPFADDSGPSNIGKLWKEVPSIRRLVSGTYVAK